MYWDRNPRDQEIPSFWNSKVLDSLLQTSSQYNYSLCGNHFHFADEKAKAHNN